MTAGFVITMGTLGNRIGRRRLLLIGTAEFGAASVRTAFSTGATLLIGARFAPLHHRGRSRGTQPSRSVPAEPGLPTRDQEAL